MKYNLGRTVIKQEAKLSRGQPTAALTAAIAHSRLSNIDIYIHVCKGFVFNRLF